MRYGRLQLKSLGFEIPPNLAQSDVRVRLNGTELAASSHVVGTRLTVTLQFDTVVPAESTLAVEITG